MVVDADDFTGDGLDARSVVVVATQGHGDEEALERAVAAQPAFVGLVASQQAWRGRARLPRRPRRLPRGPRPGAGPGRAGPRPHRPPRDRRLDPGRAGAAAGHRRPRAGASAVGRTARDAPARRDRHGDRPGVRDDRERRRRQPPARARRDDVLVLLRGLPRPVRGRSRAVPVHRLARARRPDAAEEHLRRPPPRRRGLGVLRGHPAGRGVPARRRADRGHRRGRLQGPRRGRPRTGQAALQRRRPHHRARRRGQAAGPRRPGRRREGPRPGQPQARRPADPDEHAAPRSSSTRTSTCPVPPRSTAAA